jgi:uncharacterized protein involved in exopolysaccharide biosynthesis
MGDSAKASTGEATVSTDTSKSRSRFWPYAIVCMLLFAAVGAYVGYAMWKPLYQSTAMIEVIPNLPKILYSTEQNAPLQMYEGFINTQKELLGSHRVMELAMLTPEWKQLGRDPMDEDVSQQLRQNLSVSRKPGSQVIAVSFVDEDPSVPKVVVGAVIDTYLDIFGENNTEQRTRTDELLAEERRRLEQQVYSLKAQITELAKEYGSDSVSEAYQHKLRALLAMEDQLKGVELELVVAEAEASLEAELVPAAVPETSSNRTTATGQILSSAFEAGELTRNDVQLAAGSSQEFSDPKTFGVEIQADRGKETEPEASVSPTRRVKLLKTRKATLLEMHDNAKEEVHELGKKNRRISDAKDELERLNQQRNEAHNRLDALALETRVGGRIRTLSVDNRPGCPMNLKTRRQLSVLGGLVGMVLGGVIVGLAGWRKRGCC